MHHPPIDPIAFFSLCLSTSSLTPLSGIKVLGPAVTESTVNPIPVVAVERTGIVLTTGSAFNGGTCACAVDDGIFWTISVQIARRCHRRLLVNCSLDGIGEKMEVLTRPRPPFGPMFSHLLSPYTHPSASVACHQLNHPSNIAGTYIILLPNRFRRHMTDRISSTSHSLHLNPFQIFTGPTPRPRPDHLNTTPRTSLFALRSNRPSFQPL